VLEPALTLLSRVARVCAVAFMGPPTPGSGESARARTSMAEQVANQLRIFVPGVLATMGNHVSRQDVVVPALSALTNVAGVQSSVGVDGGALLRDLVGGVGKALKAHPADLEVLEAALPLLNNVALSMSPNSPEFRRLRPLAPSALAALRTYPTSLPVARGALCVLTRCVRVAGAEEGPRIVPVLPAVAAALAACAPAPPGDMVTDALSCATSSVEHVPGCLPEVLRLRFVDTAVGALQRAEKDPVGLWCCFAALSFLRTVGQACTTASRSPASPVFGERAPELAPPAVLAAVLRVVPIVRGDPAYDMAMVAALANLVPHAASPEGVPVCRVCAVCCCAVVCRVCCVLLCECV
jgi:hypothetical protein